MDRRWVAGRGDHAASCQDQELQKSRRSPVAVAKRVQPRYVEMCVDCRGDNQRESDLWVIGSEGVALQPLGQSIDQVFTVLSRCAPVICDADGVVPHLPGQNVRFVVGSGQHLAVEVANQIPSNRGPIATSDLCRDRLQPVQHVSHLPLLVFTGRRCAECPTEDSGDLLFCKGISLDCGGRMRSPDHGNLVETTGDVGLERDASEVLAHDPRLAQQHPDPGAQPVDVSGVEGDPRVRILV